MSAKIYKLRPDAVPIDVVECLTILRKQAVAKRLTGIAFVATVEDYGFIANAAGEAYLRPQETRKMLRALDKKLAGRPVGGGL